MNLIGISARMGGGKDLTGQIIQYLTTGGVSKVFTFEEWINKPHYSRDAAPWQIHKFAAKLKECAEIITGIPCREFEHTVVKDGLISEAWGDLTVRKFLQLFGTEVGRSIHENFWINALFSGYKPIDRRTQQDPDDSSIGYPSWIITDCRFPNEAEAVLSRGGIMIRLMRNSNVPSDHTSETALDNYTKFDYVIDNRETTIDQLIKMVKGILIFEKIITKD